MSIVIPSFILLCIFVYGFIIWSVITSLSKWDGIVPDFTFVGFANYESLFQNVRFQNDLWNTFFFTLFFIILSIVIGFVLALLIDRLVKGAGFFKTLFLFPMAISFVVTGVVWRWIFSPRMGINALVKMLIPAFQGWGWYTDPSQFLGFHVALIPVIIASSWQLSGYTMAMILAGLRGIPEEILEAVQIDGANGTQTFFRVIVPLLKPIILSALIVLGHISLKIFDLVYTMTGAGPAFATDVPGIFMFETTFRGNHYAEGASIAMVMLVMVALVIGPYLYNTLRKEKN